ncbi:hypothetical protein HZB01_04935 [Candidatus Woesearchaeota archaeon]|nr:hypothetical protein [Candidatus Woesearchaeota archaeon]
MGESNFEKSPHEYASLKTKSILAPDIGYSCFYNFTRISIGFSDLYEDLLGEVKRVIKIVYHELKLGGFGSNENDQTKEFDDILDQRDDKHMQREEDIRIWGVNLFTPDEVKKYGRERLLHAPCEVIEEWEDGAVFMMINKDQFSSIYEQRKKLRDYLGVE